MTSEVYEKLTKASSSRGVKKLLAPGYTLARAPKTHAQAASKTTPSCLSFWSKTQGLASHCTSAGLPATAGTRIISLAKLRSIWNPATSVHEMDVEEGTPATFPRWIYWAPSELLDKPVSMPCTWECWVQEYKHPSQDELKNAYKNIIHQVFTLMYWRHLLQKGCQLSYKSKTSEK